MQAEIIVPSINIGFNNLTKKLLLVFSVDPKMCKETPIYFLHNTFFYFFPDEANCGTEVRSGWETLTREARTEGATLTREARTIGEALTRERRNLDTQMRIHRQVF